MGFYATKTDQNRSIFTYSDQSNPNPDTLTTANGIGKYIANIKLFTSPLIPTVQSSNINMIDSTSTTAKFNWTRGNGEKCAVFVCETDTGLAYPLNNTTYVANSVFGTGSQIGDTGWYCVYNGTEDSVFVTNLVPNRFYRIHICEYNGLYDELYLTDSSYVNPLKFKLTQANPISYQTIVVNNLNINQQFGNSISILGDTAIIGSAGSAYIFVFQNYQWEQIAVLGPSIEGYVYGFGQSVSITKDYAFVSSPRENTNGICSGAVHIYRHHNGNWLADTVISNPDYADSLFFGNSIAAYGNSLVVGAPGYGLYLSNTGHVYMYNLENDNWTLQTELIPSDIENGDSLGCSVDLFDNYAILGACNDDDNGYRSGSAYVFYRKNGTWFQQAKLLPPSGYFEDRFGISVALDNFKAIVGSPGYDSNLQNSGTAYVFNRTGEHWEFRQQLNPSLSNTNDYFGSSVGIFNNNAIVGAPFFDGDTLNTGASFLYSFDGSTWNEWDCFEPSDIQYNDQLGSYVAINDEWTLTSAIYDDGDSLNTGIVYAIKNTGVPSDLSHANTKINPIGFTLFPNYPNPFNPTTTISLQAKRLSKINILAYDHLGRLMDVIFDGSVSSGKNTFDWNASNFSSGIYYIVVKANSLVQCQKVLLLK